MKFVSLARRANGGILANIGVLALRSSMSTPISAAAVNNLRKRTDLPMMDCKSALVEAAGDMEKAIQILRERNSKVSVKRSMNETAEGRIAIYIDPTAKAATILDMRCESAPTAK